MIFSVVSAPNSRWTVWENRSNKFKTSYVSEICSPSFLQVFSLESTEDDWDVASASWLSNWAKLYWLICWCFQVVFLLYSCLCTFVWSLILHFIVFIQRTAESIYAQTWQSYEHKKHAAVVSQFEVTEIFLFTACAVPFSHCLQTNEYQ